jgi:cold shock CspA family protein
MQGTIKEFDGETRSGSLLTDDRSEIVFDAGSFADDTLRVLRFGQRVRFEVADENGRRVARALKLVTFA